MESQGSWLPIKLLDLDQFKTRSNNLLSKTSWSPKVVSDKIQAVGDNRPRFRPTGGTSRQSKEVSVFSIARSLSNDDLLLTEDVNRVLNVVRTGMQIGMYLSAAYTQSSGLDLLQKQNTRGALPASQEAEFREETNTSAAIAVFGAASYIVYTLSSYKTDEVDGLKIDFDGLPELSLESPAASYRAMVFYYGSEISSRTSVKTGLDLVKLTILYFQGVLEELASREGSLKHTSYFIEKKYKLENSDFFVDGFNVDFTGAQVSIEFNRVEFSEIVGNRAAKHAARRLAERLAAYCPTQERNPFDELGGGMPKVRMGFGYPGTGKSMQISATATYLMDLCEMIGIPFQFWPLPGNIISTFQGGSAEHALKWFSVFRNPKKVFYGPIDDGENTLEDRTRQGVSSGVREVVGTFLRETEGASAIAFKRGNTAIEIFTNIPDQIDPAVLSRIVARFPIDGSEDWQDWLDQGYLWWRLFREINPEFVDLADPKDYEYMAAQAALGSLSEVFGDLDEPVEESVQTVWRRTKDQYNLDSHEFYAHLFAEVQKKFPGFRNRDVRNIQQATSDRILDFDLPTEWLENPELFYRQSYEMKLEMLRDLMRQNSQNLSFSSIYRQETIRYLDNMVRLSETTRRKRIRERAQEIIDHREASTMASSMVDD